MTAGLLIALAAACCYELGYVLQAFEARDIDSSQPESGPLLSRLLRRRRWLAGSALALAGAGLQVLALTRAPLTLVQPTLALGLVLLVILARIFLHENAGRLELAGVAAVVAGVAVTALASPPAGDHSSPGKGLAFVLIGLGSVAVLPTVLRGRLADPRPQVLAAAAGDAWAAIALKLLADAAERGAWVVAGAWAIGAGLAGVVALNSEMTALQRIAATRVAPVVLAAQVVVPVVTAALVLGEGWGDTPLNGWLLAASIATVTGGAIALGASRPVAQLRVR